MDRTQFDVTSTSLRESAHKRILSCTARRAGKAIVIRAHIVSLSLPHIAYGGFINLFANYCEYVSNMVEAIVYLRRWQVTHSLGFEDEDKDN